MEQQTQQEKAKDIDARWTKKNNENHFGYKNHVKVNNEHKFINTQHTTNASVQDSRVVEELLDEEKDKKNGLLTDSAYTGEK